MPKKECKNLKAARTHVRRLQERNNLLAECLADERKARKEERKRFCKVITSPFRKFMAQLEYVVVAVVRSFDR